ncbi:MAG: hypothetical protein NTU49_09150 [Gammaproteobacteria bacterium]|nr:hypothetical protein [Gammaproteobacteria bacterium]
MPDLKWKRDAVIAKLNNFLGRSQRSFREKLFEAKSPASSIRDDAKQFIKEVEDCKSEEALNKLIRSKINAQAPEILAKNTAHNKGEGGDGAQRHAAWRNLTALKAYQECLETCKTGLKESGMSPGKTQ